MKQSKSTDNSYTFIQSIHTGYNYEYGHLVSYYILEKKVTDLRNKSEKSKDKISQFINHSSKFLCCPEVHQKQKVVSNKIKDIRPK